jgi:hypothetical protein
VCPIGRGYMQSRYSHYYGGSNCYYFLSLPVATIRLPNGTLISNYYLDSREWPAPACLA